MGELYLEEQAFQAAIKAFEDAERYREANKPIPQLDVYRAGNWEALSGSYQHPDYAFPVVVAIDLECDYQPDAPDGSRVFEIAAVRRKGRTTLETCCIVIERNFSSQKVALRQHEAIKPLCAAQILQKFIGSAFVVGHNLEGFDCKHLRGMGVAISDEQMIDTLSIARLLYPDSVYHNLGLLCAMHGISFQGEQHTALPDAQACADLLHALGDELARRGEQLLAGFRALVPPDSAFYQAVLQPRGITVDSDYAWDLDPSPVISHCLVAEQQVEASPNILSALEQGIDALIERADSAGAYIKHLPSHQSAIILVGSQTRLERMLAQIREKSDAFVLPHPDTLLCPRKLKQTIEEAADWKVKLALYCLYRASHNHDARLLFPMRLPSDEPLLTTLRQLLLSSCCASDPHHDTTCPGVLAVQSAAQNHRILLATHEHFLHQLTPPSADLIIVDDADTLQMRFAEYLADRLTSERVRFSSPELFHLIDTQVHQYVKEYLKHPGVYERIPLQGFLQYLAQSLDSNAASIPSLLLASELTGQTLAAALKKSSEETLDRETLHANWLEIRTTSQPGSEHWEIEQWRFCSLDTILHKAFHQRFWKPYKQHLVCGRAITLGALQTEFLTRCFGLPANLPLLIDSRPPSQIYIPLKEEVRPASFLGRRPWTRRIADFLYHVIATHRHSLIVSLQTPAVANALTMVFQSCLTNCQVLSRQTGWTTTKISDRLADETRHTLAFIPPGLREEVLDTPVEVEATGPLRFLNQQDPLVAAHLRLFAKRYPRESPFHSYLLPQALLELKARLSSAAKLHIILDSGLRSKVYLDEVRSLFQYDTFLDSLPEPTTGAENIPGDFSDAIDKALDHWSVGLRSTVEEETLLLALRTYWGKNSFREEPLNQKEVIQALFDGRDQLTIAATGGGKSLCYQLPAILMAQETIPKVTLVISPLIALMQDQVEALKDKGVFSAIAWNSNITQDPALRQNYLEGIRRGWYSIIYAAPEQIHSSALSKALATREVGLIAIDEAHCVSQWGHNFRTAYIALKRWIETEICDRQKRPFPIIALTATARKGYRDSTTGAVEQGTVEEIIENLGLRIDGVDVKMASIERPELEYCVEQIFLPCPHCQSPLAMNVELVKCSSCGRWYQVEKEQIKQAKVERLISLLADRSGQGLHQRWERPFGHRQRGLIYCAYTATTTEIVDILRADPRLEGLHVERYHGKMSDVEKNRIYKSFIGDDRDGVDIVVATNAFGMGIDVRRLGFVIHFDIPGTLEAYIQEAGRAGRDPEFKQPGVSARCVLLYHEHDLGKQRNLNKKNSIEELDIVSIYESLRKFRRHNEREIFVREHDLVLVSGLENDSKIGTVLYYLEKHTCVYGNPLIERGEYVYTEWILAFEHGFEERIHTLVPDTPSRRLIDVFRYSEQYQLQERETRLIDGDNLADSLGWNKEVLLREIRNLVSRNLLVHANQVFIRWSKSKVEAEQRITELEREVGNLLRDIPDQRTLHAGKRVAVSLERLQSEGKLGAFPLPILTRFLNGITKNKTSELRLFEYFERTLSSGNYELQLVAGQQAARSSERIFRMLRGIIQCYAPDKHSESYSWQVLDLLSEEEDYEQRRSLAQGIELLAKLDLLSLQSPESQKSAIKNQVQARGRI